MSIPTESYEAIFEQYSAAIKWMDDLGVKLNPGRTSHYERVLRYWKDAYKTASVDEWRKICPDIFSSVFEVHDFVNIHRAFRNLPPNQLVSIVDKLQKGVNGPINVADETPQSTADRNYLFEVSVAAKAHRPEKGVEAILDSRSDTGIRIAGKKIWIECKRVTTFDKIERNVRDASRQLQKVFNKEVGSGHRGIVAIDISKVLNSGSKIFVATDDDELLASVNHMMDEFIAQYSGIWQDIYKRRHRKVIGTIFRLTFMSSSKARNIPVYTSQWAMNPRLGIAASDELIQRQLVDLLQSGW